MNNRLVCVYVTHQGHTEALKIEVCKDTHSNTLSPFIRKTTVEELHDNHLSSPREMVYMLNQLGLSKQPFIIEAKYLHYESVVRILQQNPWHYRKDGGNGSLKKTVPLLNIAHPTFMLPMGNLIGGELYITNPVTWNKHIRVRLCYQGALASYYPVSNDLPCLDAFGRLFVRDERAECGLLHVLGSNLDAERGELNLPYYDIDRLSDITSHGWQVFVKRSDGSRSSVYAHHSSSGISWFDTDNDKEIDEHIVTEMLNSYLQGRNYVQAKGRICLFRSSDVQKQKSETLAEKIIPGGVSRIYEHLGDTLSQEEKHRIDKRLCSVNATLYPYQREGVHWLALMRKRHVGCLLADEMGLGKTLQILSHLYCIEHPSGPFLVVVPTSLIYNWEHEVRKFIPEWGGSLCIKQHQPNPRVRIILVSYDLLRMNLSAYQKVGYDTIVVDEAQIIKNRDTKKYQAIASLKSAHRIILTGTPIENSMNDIWSHFMLLMPSMKQLYKRLTAGGVAVDSPQFMEMSRKLLQPFILRREKHEVQKDLPRRLEKTVFIDLSDKERQIYDNVRSVFVQAFRTGVSGRVSSLALEGLMRMHQACVSPRLLPSTLYKGTRFKSSKMEMALEYIKAFRSEGRKVLMFSQFVEALEEMERYLQELNIGYVHLYGKTRDRQTAVESFQKNKGISVFLISLKAGGVGLNLTAATRVLFMDDWWNPAVEDQASSRAHRLGQSKDVVIFRLVCKGTMEEKILQLQEKKKRTIDIFNAASKLSMDDIKELIE